MIKLWLRNHKIKLMKWGVKFFIFAVCLEVFEHTALPAIMIYFDKAWLSWIGMTPLDELVIYPLVLRFVFKVGKN